MEVWRFFFFFQAEDGIRDLYVTGVQTCALPILEARKMEDRTIIQLTRQPGGLQAYKMIIPPGRPTEQRTHEGYEWLYVLSGRARLLLADHDITLTSGEAAERSEEHTSE